jgi:hypothetical protein
LTRDIYVPIIGGMEQELDASPVSLTFALGFALVAAAIAVAAAEYTGYTLGDAEDAVVVSAIAQEGCIAQYAAGERYAMRKPHKCAPMVEANHILTMPVSQ